jgi:hypothetical protein
LFTALPVCRWRREYMAEGVMNGSGWEHEMDLTQDFRAFMTAVGTLVGQDF